MYQPYAMSYSSSSASASCDRSSSSSSDKVRFILTYYDQLWPWSYYLALSFTGLFNVIGYFEVFSYQNFLLMHFVKNPYFLVNLSLFNNYKFRCA